jgi:hypothetical protein
VPRARPRLCLLCFLVACLGPGPASAEERGPSPFLDLETGAVLPATHEVRAPADGTTFSLSGGDFQGSTTPFVRVGAGARLGRHTLLLAFAPLRLSGSGASSGTVAFRGLLFSTGGDASYRYRLDTYRFTYRYGLLAWPSLELAVGAGALVRDTELRLSQVGQTAVARDTGILPVASLRLAWRFAGPFGLALDGEAGAASGRRQEDASLALEFTSSDLTFRAGYRLAEGGVDAPHLRDLALYHHLLVGVSYRF